MKKKNEGFTLVELVIAVVILAIAVSPLVSNFIQSSKMNLKARKSLNAMNLAQDIMEGMSQYSVSENTMYFDGATVSVNTLENKRILPSGTTVSSCASVSSDNKKKVYELTGVQTTTGTYNNYDITLTFDANPKPSVNNKDYASIAEIDQYYDAVHTISASEETDAIGDLITKSSDPSKSDADYKGNVTRDIVINITSAHDLVNNTDTYNVEVVKKYSVLATKKSALGFGSTNPNKDYVSTKKVDSLSKAPENIMPRSIYLYFEGMRGSDYSGNILDNIYINNTSGKPITVYLIRTVDGTKLTMTSVVNYNNNYGANVYVTDADEKTDLVSNLRFNLTMDDNFRLYKEGAGSVLADGMTAADVARTNGYNSIRCNYYYNDTSTKIDEDTYVKHISDGYQKSKRNLLYDVTVEIKESGKSNTIATYTGGLSD